MRILTRSGFLLSMSLSAEEETAQICWGLLSLTSMGKGKSAMKSLCFAAGYLLICSKIRRCGKCSKIKKKTGVVVWPFPMVSTRERCGQSQASAMSQGTRESSAREWPKGSIPSVISESAVENPHNKSAGFGANFPVDFPADSGSDLQQKHPQQI